MSRFVSCLLVVLSLAVLLGLTSGVQAAEKATGKVKMVKAEQMQFVITDKEGKDWTFQVNDKTKISVAGKASELKDLKAGDQVEVSYLKLGTKNIATEVRSKKKT